ncbi:MAG: YceI family protein [Pseudomonadota bacterium]
MIRTLSAIAAALFLAACGGEPEETVRPEAQALEVPELIGASAWTVDAEASSVGFRGTMNGNEFSGDFSNFAIAIVLDPEAPESEGAIKALIDVGSATASDSEKTNALPTETWFHVEAHPVATFSAETIASTGPGTYEASGSLSLKGISKAVSVPFTLTIDEAGRAVADATVQLNRSDFQVGTGEFAEGKWVAFEVAVDLHIEAEPAN